jgi:hypothetical protein
MKMRSYKDSIIIDQPTVANYTLTGNGYISLTLTFPDENNKTRTFWPVEALSTKVIRLSAATQNIKFKILASIDKDYTFTETEVAETTLAVGVPYSHIANKTYTALQIQVKPATSDVFGTLTTYLFGTSSNDMSSVQLVAEDINIGNVDVVSSTTDALIGALTTPAAGSVNAQLADIEDDLDTIAGAVGSSKINVNISSGNPSTTPDTSGSDFAKLTTLAATLSSISGTQIGPITTTASDVDAFTATGGWSVLGFKNCTMILHNTHATLTLIYTIIGYPGAITGNGTTEFTGTLAALTQQEFVIEKKYNKIVCNVKDGSGHATYTLDYCGGQ